MSAIGRAGSAAGFTLIEMLVVTALLALVGGLVFPSLFGLADTARFSSATRLTELALRQAHADALRTGRAVRFAADQGGAALFVSHRPLILLPPPTRAEAPADGILFFADGSASGGIVRIDDGRRRRHLRVSEDDGAIAPLGVSAGPGAGSGAGLSGGAGPGGDGRG